MMMYNMGEVSHIVDTKGESMETSALIAIALIKLNRPEVAETFVKKLLGISDEEALFQLSSAWTALAKGEYDEADSIANELSDRYGTTPIIANLAAVCALHDENFGDAKHQLTAAIEASTENGDKEQLAASLVNMVTYCRNTGEEFAEFYDRL
jgi:predicted Zn-dependent protease